VQFFRYSYVTLLRKLWRRWRVKPIGYEYGVCPVCGETAAIVPGSVLWPELIAEWELTPEWAEYFDQREGHRCGKCQVSLRSQSLARGILRAGFQLIHVNALSLRALCQEPAFRSLHQAEINSAGGLHPFLAELPNLRYSEFGGMIPGVPSEDLMALSYATDSLDMVITSESLEHIPDVTAVLREIHRVLRPGGFHVFTVPIVWDRAHSRTRASLRDGKIVHHFPPSYHGRTGIKADDLLVFHEFGRDFIGRCKTAGFETEVLHHPQNPALLSLLTRKPAAGA
jgi:SAM-dependent methyltransferase